MFLKDKVKFKGREQRKNKGLTSLVVKQCKLKQFFALKLAKIKKKDDVQC